MNEQAVLKDFRLNRLLSEPLTKILLALPVRPNHVTCLSLACGVMAGVLFASGRFAESLAGALLYQAACVLDNCDGEIARVKNMGSAFGAWFDIGADFVTDLCLFGGLGLGMMRFTDDAGVRVFTALCLFGALMHFSLVVLEKTRGFGPAQYGSPNPGRRGALSVFFDALREGDASWVVVLLALIGKAHTLIWFGAVYMQVLWIGALAANFSHLSKPK